MGITELSAEYWDLQMRFAPQNATMYGDHRFDDQLGDVSAANIARGLSELRAIATRAEAIDATALSRQDRVTRQMLIDAVRSAEIQLDEIGLELRIDPMIGVHSQLLSTPSLTAAEEPEHAMMFLERYKQVGQLMDDHLAWHQQGVEKNRVAPANNIRRALAQMDSYLSSPIESDPFLSIAVPDWDGRDQWRSDMMAVIKDHIRPAFQHYRDTIAATVAPHGRPEDRAGLSWIDGGSEYYERLIRDYTTVDLTADEIHQIGLDEMTRLHGEFAKYGQSALGVSDLSTLFERLRTDESLRFSTVDEVLAFSRDVIERAEAITPNWFGHLPESPCVVAEIPADLAPNMPPAYYFPPPPDGSRPGTYFVNTADPHTVHRFDMTATAVHEAVPGHHLQCAINAEAGDLPMFRRYEVVMAYTEGWGLYAERLADEMGLYQTDLDRLGLVTADAWRAARLVVDTGIHAKGWSRQQAIDYMTENTPIKHDMVSMEVDRYVGFPGQALTYKIGQREFLRLRRLAEDRLGDRFDIKAFHDTVLTSGAVPLPVLASLVEDWLETSA